ncbi:hypothetical protein F0562_034617 [Nyssa sinensis]|uniref:SAP domain-containing protein n=1 Tax=Nyssa sinensis TaxID=561372 RepID=A0A5J5AC09_9ASTE|nr:hypothetical protein F0562_034617 [Nyssa sinensis]
MGFETYITEHYWLQPSFRENGHCGLAAQQLQFSLSCATPTLRNVLCSALFTKFTFPHFPVNFPANFAIRQMENKDDGVFYCGLSKKELQDLCKKYGLSPHKTKSSLVNSLNSYFERKNLGLLPPAGRSSVCSTSLMPQLQLGAHSSSMADGRKGSYGIITCPGGEENRGNKPLTIKYNGLGSCTGTESYDKASGVEISEDFGYSMYKIRDTSHLTNKKRKTSHSKKRNLAFAREVGMGNMHQIQHRNISHGACLADNASTSTMKSSTALPSFEFYVRSEEGINLIVDLNSSPSDWPKRLENGVCLCQTMHENKFRSFCEELELLENSNKQMKSSSLWNTNLNREMDDGHVKVKSSSTSNMREDGHMEFDHPDGGDETLRLTAIEPSNDGIEISAHLEEEKDIFPSSRLDSDVDQMISGMESCLGDGETKSLNPDVSDIPQIKVSCNSDISLTSKGPKNLNMLGQQDSKLGDENCENLTLQNTWSIVNPNVVYPGCLKIGSVEMQLSEVASQGKDPLCSPCKNNGFLDLVDAPQKVGTGDGGLANANEMLTYQEII